MRKSVVKTDRGYDPKAQWKYVIFLNGIKLDHCFTADEEQGIAYINKTAPDKTSIMRGFVKGYVKIKKI